MGEYEYEQKKGEVKEHIVFWQKQHEESLVSSVDYIINGNDINPNDIDFIIIAHRGDHGHGKFRYLGKTIVRAKDDAPKHTGKYFLDIHSLGNVDCKKDNSIELENTIMPQMGKTISNIAEMSINRNPASG